MNSPLDSIVYITLPENFQIPQGAFLIDPTIPLPVQKTTGFESEQTDTSSLTWEMILAGILTICAYERDNKNIAYYRSLLLSVKPNIKQELSEAAILKARNEDFDIAEEIFAALRGLDPEDMAIVLNSALFYDERGSSYRKSGLIEDADACDETAYEYYKQAVAAEPPIPDAFFNTGFFFLKQRNFTKAKQEFETYLTLTDDIDDEKLSKNGAYKKQRAKEIVEDISSRNLEDEMFKAAYDFIKMGEEEKGLDYIRRFLEKNPKVWNAWFMLGWGLRRLERYEDAKAAFEQSLTCGGDTLDTHNELAICMLELGDFDGAKQHLMKALSFQPDSTKIMSNLGILAQKRGDTAEARKYFMAVLEFDPKDVIAKQALKEMEA